MISGTGKNKAEYLRDIKFPDIKNPGPSIRSGDFAEILVADYLKFCLNHWIPDKYKYSRKMNRNTSIHGCDVVGFYFSDTDKPLDDILSIYEVKASLSAKPKNNRLQDAVDDSSKDSIRKAETLNALKQRALERGDAVEAKRIERFQNINDRPFTERYGAVAVLDNTLYDDKIIKKANISAHSHSSTLSLLVIKGDNMKQLVNDLYERAASEA